MMPAPDRTIHRETLYDGEATFHLPADARFLHCGELNGGVGLWFEIPGDDVYAGPKNRHVFRLVDDRDLVPEGWTYVGTVHLAAVRYPRVVHVYEADR